MSSQSRCALWSAAAALALLCAGLARAQGPEAAGLPPIEWLNADAGAAVSPSQRAPAATLAEAGARHVVVQFTEVPTLAEREALEASGIELLHYLGSGAYFAAVKGGEAAVSAADRTGLAVAYVPPVEVKVHPRLLSGDVPPYALFSAPGTETALAPENQKPEGDVDTVALCVLFHPDVDLDTVGKALIERHGGLVRDEMRSINAVVAWLPLANLLALAQEDAVEWIEPPLPPLGTCNAENRSTTGVDIVNAPPYGLDGTGVNVLVYDGGYADSGHPDFGGRLTVHDTSGLSSHATHVAGTIGGDGTNSAGANRGMAPGVLIHSYGFEYDGTGTFLYTNPGDLEDDYNEAINVYGAMVANNSIGTNTCANGFNCDITGDYGTTDMLIDAIVGGSLGEPMRIVWANGNERSCSRCSAVSPGGYHSTAPPACAKNHITVGALNALTETMTSFSSWGPTDDGRLKPDISAPGCQAGGDGGVTSTVPGGGYGVLCGTSMATPTVTGICALLLQDHMDQYPGEPLPRNSTLKVLLAHTAADLGNAGPDYQYGYGAVRAQAAVDHLRSGSFLEDEVAQGEELIYFVNVPPGTATLRATIAWDDPPGVPLVSPSLVNDLDITAIAPGGGPTHYPWTLDPAIPANPAVRTQPDHVNNIEQVLVDSPAAGVWQIRVVGTTVAVGTQVFSLATTPDVLVCSSAGVIALDSDAYRCSDTATVTVNDCDLNLNPAVAETVSVNVRSSSEPTGESVLLTETGPNTATFTGSLTLSTTDGAGVLLVAHGDTVTGTYDDADDGSGSPAAVTDTATVDCVAPVISAVTATGITSNGATINFNTDEPTNGTVRHGMSCGALDMIRANASLGTAHSIDLTGLTPDTTYFFVVDAEDPAGNLTTANNGGSCFSFTTLVQPDYFTELFDSAANDLDDTMLTFTPDGSADFYELCRTEATSFPTDPSGGTTLGLSDDSFALVNLGGPTVSLYGTAYGSFYVGSNGYITFTAGDTDFTESLADHFDLPRISALFDDLVPNSNVSYKILGDRAVVTWLGIRQFGLSDSNSFQVEMFFDGRIRITCLGISATDGLTGLSQGLGVPPDFVESDLNSHGCPACPAPPTPTNPTPADGATGVPVNTVLTWEVTENLAEGCDVTYDVYLDTVNPPTTLVCDDMPDPVCVPPELLANGVTYHWQVIAQSDGGTTPGPVWSFTTAADPPPVVLSVTRLDPSPTNAAQIRFLVTFSESVTGFGGDDLGATITGSISGPSLAGISGSGATRTVTGNTGTGSGTIRLNILDNDSIRDIALNPLGGPGAGNGSFFGGETYVIDKQRPTVSLSAPNPVSGPFTVTVTFSEPVTGFSLADVSGSNATVSDLAGSGAVYTFTATPISPGTVSGFIVNDAAFDAAGNGSVQSAVGSVVYAP